MLSAQGGTRTRTAAFGRGILNPLCLPIPPPGRAVIAGLSFRGLALVLQATPDGTSESQEMAHLFTSQSKASKPMLDFAPLAHGSGQWAMKIRGRLVYFGV